MDRATVAKMLEEIGNLHELMGDNFFKARAYYTAARLFQEMDVRPDELVESGRLKSLPGIGDALTQKITELVRTGRLAYYEKLRDSIPGELIAIMNIPGVGPRRANAIHRKLGIETVSGLDRACQDGRLMSLRGFDEKVVHTIAAYAAHMRK